MAQPIRRTTTAVRAYADQLRDLMDQLRADPLDEAKSLALVTYIVNNRSAAAQLWDTLETALGAVC